MKAWTVRDIERLDSGVSIVFAETRAKAISAALGIGNFEDSKWCDIRATRFKEFDDKYIGKTEIDWDDPEIRLILVRDYDWSCMETSDRCEGCSARKWCMHWEDDE